MACNKFVLSATIVLAGLVALSLGELPASRRLKANLAQQQRNERQRIDSFATRNLLDRDFESGSMSPWYDESPAYVTWRVEDVTTPSEADYPAPRPLNGTKYARATRNANLQSGLAVLRSPLFTAMPGDTVTFDFWIRSKRPEGNTLELVWLVGRDEVSLTTVSKYSTSSNMEWRTITTEIPVNAPTEGVLIFYGYCGINYEDAIAIDNIKVESVPPPTEPTTVPPVNDRCKVYSVTSAGIFIASPNFPENYPDDAFECWVFENNNYSYLYLDFISFETESNYDKLNVYSGFNSTEYLLDSFSGTRSNSYTYFYGYKAYTFEFKSDESKNFAGFYIRVYGS